MIFPNFEIKFENSTIFKGDSLKNEWSKLPELPIVEVIFICGKIILKLNAYKEYNHLVERISFMGKGEKISKFLIMARKEKTTDIFEFNLQRNRVQRIEVPIGQEYNGQLLNGWKKGVDGKGKFEFLTKEK